jgi:hypothetical protein
LLTAAGSVAANRKADIFSAAARENGLADGGRRCALYRLRAMLPICGKFTRALLAHPIFLRKNQDFLKENLEFSKSEKGNFYQNLSHLAFFKNFQE